MPAQLWLSMPCPLRPRRLALLRALVVTVQRLLLLRAPPPNSGAQGAGEAPPLAPQPSWPGQLPFLPSALPPQPRCVPTPVPEVQAQERGQLLTLHPRQAGAWLGRLCLVSIFTCGRQAAPHVCCSMEGMGAGFPWAVCVRVCARGCGGAYACLCMSMSVCEFVCLCVGIPVSVCVCMSVSMGVSVHTHTYMRLQACTSGFVVHILNSADLKMKTGPRVKLRTQQKGKNCVTAPPQYIQIRSLNFKYFYYVKRQYPQIQHSHQELEKEHTGN